MTRETARRMYAPEERRRRGEVPLRSSEALEALPEPMRQAVLNALGGRTNVRAYLVDGDLLPQRGEVIIRNL